MSAHLPNEEERLTVLAASVHAMVSHTSIPTAFFCTKYHRGVEAACLIDAALNADHKKMHDIIAGCRNRAELKKLLSATSTATITHLGIQRTGTVLQMALYSHDSLAFKGLADWVDEETIRYQSEEVFRRCGVCDYSALIEKQKAEANQLCHGIEVTFSRASSIDTENAVYHALETPLNNFNITLNRYVEANSVHNPYILQRLLEIYDGFFENWNRECLLSQKVVGLVQKFSSVWWLLRNAEGIFSPGASCNNKRVFEFPWSFVNTSILPHLGVDSCIEVLRGARRPNEILTSRLGRSHYELNLNARSSLSRSGIFTRALAKEQQFWIDHTLRAYVLLPRGGR